MNKKLFIITGAPNSRKSSVIRALTGIYQTDTFQMQFANNPEVVETHVMVASPNEIKSTVYERGMNPQQLINYINNLNNDVTAVILPLRSSNSNFDLPLASEYIKALRGADFEIMIVAMFNDEIALPNGVN